MNNIFLLEIVISWIVPILFLHFEHFFSFFHNLFVFVVNIRGCCSKVSQVMTAFWTHSFVSFWNIIPKLVWSFFSFSSSFLIQHFQR